MSRTPEPADDTKRLAKRAKRWRWLALFTTGILVAVVGTSLYRSLSQTQGPQIARITVSGIITDNRAQSELLARIAKADNVKAVIVDINSPGGTTAGGEALYEGLRRIAAKKPVVGQFGTVAASAAYITGLACDHIVARGNTITGSVGVIIQYPEVSGLLDKLGVKMTEVKSGPLKATPSPYAPLDERSRKITEEMIAESQAWFVGLVETRRKITAAGVPGLLEGRVFSGREALRHKMIDAIGSEAEAVAWLEGKGVAKGLQIIDWKPPTERGWASSLGATSLVESWIVGPILDAVGARVRDDALLGRLTLDGMLSIAPIGMR